MPDREKVIKDLEFCVNGHFKVELSLATKILALLKEQKGLMLALEQSNAVNEYLNAEVERLTGLLKEQEAIIEQYRRADGFLVAHGWKWEGR